MNQNGKNFKVFQASAGSGKTYTIIKEYLKLCLRSKNQVKNFQNILAITFTNASANDMKAKIIKDLKAIISSSEVKENTMEADLIKELGISDAELKQNAQLLLTQIIHDYSSFCVSTIDAFVQKISRSFARDLGLPSQYSVSIDEDEVVDTVVANLGMQINDDNKFLVAILNGFLNNQFDKEKTYDLSAKLAEFTKKLLSEKAYNRNGTNTIDSENSYQQADKFLKAKMDSFPKSVDDFIKTFDAFVSRHGLQTEDFYYGSKGLPSFVNSLKNKDFKDPNSYVQKVINGEEWYSAKAKKRFGKEDLNAIGDELKDFLPQFAKDYKEGLAEYLFYNSQRELLYLYALHTQIRGEMEKLTEDEDIVHISEFNKLISSVLGDFSVPFIYERIGEKYKHIFIDEFQDTSILQWQNLIPMIDNGLASGNMSMIVGDGKQSIYRFRSGEVEQIVKLPEIHALPQDERNDAFEHYEETLTSNFSFKNLECNYRSFSEIVNFNNDFFSKTIKFLKPDSQKVYADKDEKHQKEVRIEQQAKKSGQGLVEIDLFSKDSEKDYYLSRIKEIIDELTQKRGYEHSDICILTRKTDTGSIIANYLNDNGIPVLSNESILLKSSDKVQLIISTLHHLIEKNNKAVISEILYYQRITSKATKDKSINGCFDAVADIANGNSDIETILGIGEPGLLQKTLSRSTCLYDLCSSLMRIYGFDSTSDSFLNYLLDEMFNWQTAGKEGIMDFLDFWNKKKKKLAVKSISGNAVRIMTIHKSKGLEFNVVIYPEAITDLDSSIGGNKAVAETWVTPEELGFEAIPNLDKVLFKMTSEAKLEGNKAAQICEKEEESNRLDNCNLLYVAFTRPVERLYVLAKAGAAEKKTNVIEDYLKSHENKINRDLSIEKKRKIYQFGDPDFIHKAKNEDKSEKKQICESNTSDWFSKIQIDPMPSMFWISENDKMQPNEWGELVHEILSNIETSADIDKALLPYLSDGSIDEETANLLKDKFVQITENPIVKEAFGPKAIVKNECEILSNGEILRPDRFAELPDRILLLDYKTGKKDPKHHQQLKNYISALQGMVSKQISAYLIYLGADIEVEEVVMDTLF